MILWELNQYNPSKNDQLGDFYTEINNAWDVDAYLIYFTINKHKYVCKVYAQTQEEAVGIFCIYHPHLSYADLDDIELLEE